MRSVALFLALTASGYGADPSPEALMEANHWKRARIIAEQMYRTSPQDARANLLLSRVKLMAGDAEGALPLAEKAVALDPRKPDYHMQVAEVLGALARQSSNVFSQLGRARRIKKEMETALELDRTRIQTLYALVQFYWIAPGIAGGDKEKARALTEQMVKLDPARGYLAQTRFLDAQTEPGKLLALYQKAVQANPELYQARVQFAEFQLSQQDYKTAEQQAREGIRLDPGRIPAYSTLAKVYAAQARWNELESLLAEAGRRIPDNLAPYLQAANILLNNNQDLPRAASYVRKYLSQEPELNAPPKPAAYRLLALIFEKQGRKPDAVSALEEAIRLRPDFEAAKKDLKRIRG